jgi:hypothetical protein
MPNVSELQRLEEERHVLLDHLRSSQAPKKVKEQWLRELRAIEAQLGLPSQNYNGGDFGR